MHINGRIAVLSLVVFLFGHGAEAEPNRSELGRVRSNSTLSFTEISSSRVHRGESGGVLRMGSSFCNAWVIDENHIMTNHHCLSAGSVRVTFYVNGKRVDITNCSPRATTANRKLDYAVIKCSNIGEKVPPVKIARRELQSSEELTLWTHDPHNPQSKRASKGRVGGGFSVVGGGVGHSVDGLRVVQGNSGSAMYDKDGHVVALLWGKEASWFSRGSGAVTAMSDIVKDIESRGIPLAFKYSDDDVKETQIARPAPRAVENPRVAEAPRADVIPPRAPAAPVETPRVVEAPQVREAPRVAEAPRMEAPRAEAPQISPSYEPGPSSPTNYDDYASDMELSREPSWLEKNGTTLLVGAAAAVAAVLVYRWLTKDDAKKAEQMTAAQVAQSPQAGVVTRMSPAIIQEPLEVARPAARKPSAKKTRALRAAAR